MDTKQYLRQISRLDKMIKNKIVELYQLKELYTSISAIKSDENIQTTPNFDKIGTAYARICEKEQELDEITDLYIDKKSIIISQIDQMDDETHYEILFSRYVERKTFEKIADEMSYSWRQIIRLHGIALKEFEKLHGNEYMS